MSHLLMIEADGQPTVTIELETPEIIFQEEGLQGPPGPPGDGGAEPGDAIRVVGDVVHVDINRLTLAP
jgi:hypothetical protein